MNTNEEKNTTPEYKTGELHSEPVKKKGFGNNKTKKGNVVLAFLFSITDVIAKLVRNSFICFIFADLYDFINKKWREGFVYRLFKRRKQKGGVRVRFVQLYENSVTYSFVNSITKNVTQTYMRVWGAGFFIFSFLMILMEVVKAYMLNGFQTVSRSTVIIGAAIMLVSVSLMLSRKRFGEWMITGRFTNYVVTQVLNLDSTKFEGDDKKHGIGFSVMFIFAATFGISTFFIDQIAVIMLILATMAFAAIMCFPELGIITTIAVIPLSSIFQNPSLVMGVLILFTTVAYFSKFVRGKRIMRFDLIDLLVLAFGALIFAGGIFTQGGEESFNSAMLYTIFICAYILIVNSYIRKTWIYRGIKLMVLLTAFVATIGIIEGGEVIPGYIDIEFFKNYVARISGFLGNPNMLAAYLVIVFPFALAEAFVAKKLLAKLAYLFCAAVTLTCVILTWSRGAWLGVILATLVFLLLNNFRSLWGIILAATTSPLWVQLIPTKTLNRLTSTFIGDSSITWKAVWGMINNYFSTGIGVGESVFSQANALYDTIINADSSITYRFSIWEAVRGMIKDYFFTGIGVGESAFRNVYVWYDTLGAGAARHSHSLYYQIMLELGIVGIILFVAIMIAYSQKCFVNIKLCKRNTKSRTMIAAGYAGIVGVLLMGFTDHVWYNYRVFLIFWIAMALTVALTKINERERLKEEQSAVMNARAVDVEL